MNLSFDLIDEYRIGKYLREEIRRLLHECFPEARFTQSRSYLKQLPQKRMLVCDDDLLVGHIGIEHRVIGLGNSPAEIVGLIEVVVCANYRRQGIASRMISMILDEYGQETVEFAMLFADDGRLYEKHGFCFPQNTLTWLKLHEHRNYGIAEEVISELMIKQLSERKWTDDPVDLMGYLFGPDTYLRPRITDTPSL